MTTRERIAFTLFMFACLGFIAAALCLVETIATNELRLNQ